jgi:hypothetical protein
LSPVSAYVETNWILAMVLGEDDDAQRLLRQPPEVRLAIPDICVVEAISAFDRKRAERNALTGLLRNNESLVAGRTGIASGLGLLEGLEKARLANDAYLSDLYVRLDDTLQLVAERCDFLPVSGTILRSGLDLSVALTPAGLATRTTGSWHPREAFDRADALILSAIVEDARGPAISHDKAFLSGNVRDFESARPYLESFGVKYFRRAGRLVEWLERPREEKG